MPHLITETTRQLADRIDFAQVFAGVHRELAGHGYAQLADLKSRLLVAEVALTGDDPEAGFVVTHLVMTNARPEPEQAAMAAVVLAHTAAAVRQAAFAGNVQVCVLHRLAAPGTYGKTVVVSPGAD